MNTYVGVANQSVIPSKIYAGVSNLSKKINKIYAGVGVITNLLPSPENFNYSNASFDSNGVITYNSGTTAMVSYNMQTPIAGHIYYGRVAQKVAPNTTFADGRFEYYNSDVAGTGLLTFTSFSSTTQDNEWHNYSNRLSLSGLASETGWTLRSFAVEGTTDSYRKEHLIIDLTAHWGAGNEPSKEWCDSNIPYFVGSMTAPTSWGVQGTTKLVYQAIQPDWLPCYVRNITNTSTYVTNLQVFYMPNGDVVIKGNSTNTYNFKTDTGNTLLDGVTVKGIGATPTSGTNVMVVLSGISSMCDIEIGYTTTGTNGLYIAMTSVAGEPSEYIQNQYVQALTFTGTYATATYFTQARCGVGYAKDRSVMIVMYNGTSTSYENLYFKEDTMLTGVSLASQTRYNYASGTVSKYYEGILTGLAQNCNIEIQMNTRNSSSDYVQCDITMSAA